MEKNKIALNSRKFFQKCVVIDASVLIKAFIEENGSEIVDDLLKEKLIVQSTSGIISLPQS